jgi:hypothetical protein
MRCRSFSACALISKGRSCHLVSDGSSSSHRRPSASGREGGHRASLADRYSPGIRLHAFDGLGQRTSRLHRFRSREARSSPGLHRRAQTNSVATRAVRGEPRPPHSLPAAKHSAGLSSPLVGHGGALSRHATSHEAKPARRGPRRESSGGAATVSRRRWWRATSRAGASGVRSTDLYADVRPPRQAKE